MTIQQIDRNTPAGRLLWTALIILTTTPELNYQGGILLGTKTQPDEMLDRLEDLAQELDKRGT